VLSVDIMQLKPHVETWSDSKHSNDCVLSLTSYVLYRNDRAGRKSGGVCACVRDDIACTVLPCQSSSDIDKLWILWLHLLYEEISYSIPCFYHPPRPFARTVSSEILGFCF